MQSDGLSVKGKYNGMNTVSIVVPSYNKRDNVRSLTEQIDKSLAGISHGIIFVDDSADDTPAVLAELSVEYRHVRYEHRTNKKGLATAVIRGFQLAKGDYLAVMDANLQHPSAKSIVEIPYAF